jgi:hypothetical protein
MKKSITLIFAAGTLVLAGCCTTHHVTQWEYKNLTIAGSDPDQNVNNIHPTLNELGKEGWSVVGFTYLPADSTHVNEYIYVLKRKIH